MLRRLRQCQRGRLATKVLIRAVTGFSAPTGSGFGRVGTWVNCAAVSVWGRVEDVTDEEFDRILHVDPAKLIIGANVRVDPRLDDEFLASIKTDGVEEVVTVHRG
jgi:hypothetical protein